MLQVSVGHTSLRGPRAHNEDFCGAVTPEGSELENKGLLAALADGVGGHAHGREAAEFTVRGLLSDYYATPDTWSVPQALEKVITALNRWLVSQSAKRREEAGMATTLSAIVLRGCRYTLAHVGDSRIYRLRQGVLTRLTTDHVWEHPELKTVLSRAVGLDPHLAVDYADGELEAGDVFMLCSDGVWGSLREARIATLLMQHPDAQEAAFALADGAVEAGSQDNSSALVLRVVTLPRDTLRDQLARVSALPVPAQLKVGQVLDGLRVDAVLHESRATLIYRVLDAAGNKYVMKTLQPGADAHELATLAHEEWLARRIVDGAFSQVVSYPQRTHLYYLMSWHEGETLSKKLARGHRFEVNELAEIGLRLMKAVGVLHRMSVVHRDIKPANLHRDREGRLRLFDLGVAASDGQNLGEELGEINNPGTPTYMAPELFEGKPATESSDLYACGVTLYELATRKFPYGEIEPFQKPRFGDPVPPTRYRPDLPEWLESILLKAVARDPRQRFETAEECLLALERGANRPLVVPRRRPLAERDPYFFLKLVLAASLAANLLLGWILLIR